MKRGMRLAKGRRGFTSRTGDGATSRTEAQRRGEAAGQARLFTEGVKYIRALSVLSVCSVVRTVSVTEDEIDQPRNAQNTRKRGFRSVSSLCSPCVPWFASLSSNSCSRNPTACIRLQRLLNPPLVHSFCVVLVEVPDCHPHQQHSPTPPT